MATTGPFGLQTMTDLELQGLPRGPELSAAVDRLRSARAPMAMPPTQRSHLDLTSSEFTLTWGDFQQRHPEWQGDYWAECRALYAGGSKLLGDKKVLQRLFPSHRHEDQMVYAERCARAHYFPYPGTIIDHLLAGLGTDPLQISFTEIDEKGVAKAKPPGVEWWEQWVADVTDEAERPADYGLESDDESESDDEGGCSIHHFIVEALREALQTRTAWVLADLPPADPDVSIDSRLAAERSGLLDPYLCLIPAEQIVDWQTVRRGKHHDLVWVMMMECEQLRETPRDRRKLWQHTYTVWDEFTWRRYEFTIDPANPPAENTPYQPVDGGEHGFGRVPFERLCLPEGLHAMGKLHSLAREHFNKRCAMSWAEYKSLFAVLYEFTGPGDDPDLPVPASDPHRATNQIRGQGYSQIRSNKDRAEYVGPPAEAFVAARESCNDAMREMHRVMFSMAMSANMDSAAIKRSGDSKATDNATTEVLLDLFGTLSLRFCRRLLVLASLGRQEAVPKAQISGLDKFDVIGVDTKIAEAVQLFAGVPMLSATVKELYLARLYGDLLGDITQEQSEKIREEIRDGISMEELAAQAMAGMGPDGKPLDDDDDEPGPAPAPRKPAPGAPGSGPGKMTRGRPVK
jgi:hypothetical protein